MAEREESIEWQVCLKEAGETVRTLTEKGQGLTPEEMGARIVACAAEIWVWRNGLSLDRGPQEVRSVDAQAAPPQTATDIFDNCPDHPGQSADSQYEGTRRWCKGPDRDTKCYWVRKVFVNDDMTTVEKWGYRGQWLTKPDYLNAAQGR